MPDKLLIRLFYCKIQMDFDYQTNLVANQKENGWKVKY